MKNSNAITHQHTSWEYKAPITLFKGCLNNSAPVGFATIDQVLTEIRNDSNEELKTLAGKLLELKRTDPARYKQVKERDCPAFIIGRFPERKNEACQEYAPLLAFDVDHTEGPFSVADRIRQLSVDPHVFAAYSSPSGEGLRFLVWCRSTRKTHKQFYQFAADYFSRQLSIPTDKGLRAQWKAEGMDPAAIIDRLKHTEHIDTSTNNLARLWFYTWVPEDHFYYNPESRALSMKGEGADPSSRPAAGQLTDRDKVEVCLQKVARQNIAGGRNNFVFAFACELARHGVGESLALSECLQYQDVDFPEAEIKKTVASAYKSKSPEFTDAQILKYRAMIGKDDAPARDQVARVEGLHPGDQVADNPADSETPDGQPVQEETGEEYEKKPKFVRLRDFIDRRFDLRLNLVALEIEASKKGKNDFQVLNENDLICELLEAGFNGVEAPLISLIRSSFVPSYDPFKEYFEALPAWSPTDPDYIEHLAGYIDAKDQGWFNTQFKKMLVRSVACALELIPFNKQCFVLKGEQNDGKSTFLRFLCPPRLRNYITDHIDINNKDGRIALCQNMYINLDELSQFSRSDIRRVKALLTIDKIKERLPYGRTAVNISRRASFLGSTNDDEFLIDETGNVRWLVFEINKNGVRHDKGGPKGYNAAVDIDKVYSQAYTLLKTGFQFQMTPEEIAKSENNNQGYQIITVEHELIQEFFTPVGEFDDGAEFVTATEIMKTIETEVKTTLNNRTIGRAMRLLGFDKVQKYFADHGYQKKGYWVRRIKARE